MQGHQSSITNLANPLCAVLLLLLQLAKNKNIDSLSISLKEEIGERKATCGIISQNWTCSEPNLYFGHDTTNNCLFAQTVSPASMVDAQLRVEWGVIIINFTPWRKLWSLQVDSGLDVGLIKPNLQCRSCVCEQQKHWWRTKVGKALSA